MGNHVAFVWQDAVYQIGLPIAKRCVHVEVAFELHCLSPKVYICNKHWHILLHISQWIYSWNEVLPFGSNPG